MLPLGSPAQCTLLSSLLDSLVYPNLNIRARAYDQIVSLANVFAVSTSTNFVQIYIYIYFFSICILLFDLGDLITMHRMKLYPLILSRTRDTPTIVVEVCDALLDMDCNEFVQTAVPAVLPQLIVDHADGTLDEVMSFHMLPLFVNLSWCLLNFQFIFVSDVY